MATVEEPNDTLADESAPLLGQRDNAPQSLFARVSALTQEPLTPLTKVLLAAVLILLILFSAFLGLFVGAEHRLSSRVPNTNPGDEKSSTVSSSTIISTTTVITTAHPPSPTSVPDEVTCWDPHCVILSSSILSSLDTSQDPCNNFNEFTNGGWMKAHPIPRGKVSYGALEELSTQNRGIIKDILARNATSYSSSDAQTLTKLQDLLQSCLDEDHLNSLGIKPVTDMVLTVKKLFNGPNASVKSSHSGQRPFNMKFRGGLANAVAFLHSRAINSLFSFQIDGDVGVDPNEMTLWFFQPEFGLPSKEYFEEDLIREKYTSTITRIFLALDAEDSKQSSSAATAWPPFPWPPWEDDEGDKPKPDPRKSADRLARAVVNFEREVARASLDLDLLQLDPMGTYNPVDYANLSASLPEFDFKSYWSTFPLHSPPNRIIVTHPPYLASLSTLLSNTPDDVLLGYLITVMSLSLAEHLGPKTEIWKAHRELVEELTSIKKGAVDDREDYCSQKVETAFGFASGRFFVQEVFNENSRLKATRIITDIVAAFKRSLFNLSWMDQISATAAAEKASAVRIKVGFPLSPNTSSASAIADYYALVNVDKADFFGNMLRVSVFNTALQWRQVGKRRDLESWSLIPSQVNANSNPSSNEILFPAGILQPVFFSQDWPGYMAYAGFGAVASHELTHIFDSAGRLYDQEGKLREWWTNTTSEAFEERRQCLSRQYSKYSVDDGKGGRVHVNGNLTSGENIGDQGFIQAYRAWKAQYDDSFSEGNEYLLPGLNYTRDQLFFISFARIWAQKIKPQTVVQRIRSDPHSPNIYRLIGTLVNMPEFAAAFNCPIGSKLNPPEEKRCRLW